jgi:hypothetical protein
LIAQVDIMNSILITAYFIFFYDQDMMLHILWRARKWILPLIWLNFVVLLTWSNLLAGVTAWSPIGFLFVFGVSKLQIRRSQICLKADTPSYNFYERTLLGFYHHQVQIPSRIRATNLPCFVNGQVYQILSLIPSSSSDIAMPSPYI